MKITVSSLYQLRPLIVEAQDVDFDPNEALMISKLHFETTREFESADKLRIKIMSKYKKGVTEDNRFILPQDGGNEDGDEKFKEFITEYEKLLNAEIEINYEPIDVDGMVKGLKSKNLTVKPKILNLFKGLNDIHSEQNKKEEKAS